MKRIAALVLLTAAALARAAAPFQLALEDGSGWVAPGALEGHPAIFLFWDSECAPCLKELTEMTHLRKAFPEAVFVAVSLSGRAATRRVMAKIKLDDAVIRAVGPAFPGGLLARLGDPSGALPFAAVFSGDGAACLHHLGPLGTDFLMQAAEICAAK